MTLLDQVMTCQMSKFPSTQFEFPSANEPGIKNLVRGALASSLQPLIFVQDNVVKQLSPVSVKDLQRNVPVYVKRANDIISGDFIKPVVEQVINSSGIIIPDANQLVKNAMTYSNVSLPVLPGLSDILVDIFSEVAQGTILLTSAITNAVNNIKMKIAAAVGNAASQLSWIGEWYQQAISMITLVLSIPMFILKLIVDFVKDLIKNIGKFLELASKGIGMITSFISEKLQDLVISATQALGLNVTIPGVPVPPLPGFVACLITAVKSILSGFPGNLADLQKELVIS